MEILDLNTALCSVTTLWGAILIDSYFYRVDPAFFMPLHPDLLLQHALLCVSVLQAAQDTITMKITLIPTISTTDDRVVFIPK